MYNLEFIGGKVHLYRPWTLVVVGKQPTQLETRAISNALFCEWSQQKKATTFLNCFALEMQLYPQEKIPQQTKILHCLATQSIHNTS